MGRLADWLKRRLTGCLISWLADWQICSLADWPMGWLADWLIDWLVGWLVDWLIGSSAHWLIGSLAAWLIGRFGDWLFGCLANGRIGWLADGRNDWLDDRLIGCLAGRGSFWLASACCKPGRIKIGPSLIWAKSNGFAITLWTKSWHFWRDAYGKVWKESGLAGWLAGRLAGYKVEIISKDVGKQTCSVNKILNYGRLNVQIYIYIYVYIWRKWNKNELMKNYISIGFTIICSNSLIFQWLLFKGGTKGIIFARQWFSNGFAIILSKSLKHRWLQRVTRREFLFFDFLLALPRFVQNQCMTLARNPQTGFVFAWA